MTRLLVSTSIVVLACSLAAAAPATTPGAPAPSGTPDVEESLGFRASPAFALGSPFADMVFGAATILPVMPVGIQPGPELFVPVLTGSRQAPALPVRWADGRDSSLGGRFLATTNHVSGPRDELRPMNPGLRAALNGTGPDRVTAEWALVQRHLEKQLIDYAFDFGTQDLIHAVAENERLLALFQWNGEIKAPVVAQGD